MFQSYKFPMLVVVMLVQGILSQVAPTWTASNYLQAGTKLIIDGYACNCKTGNQSTPAATVTFATAFPSVPNLGFGASGYDGDDPLVQEMWQINRTSLTADGFGLIMQISGYTHLWVVQIRYVAISKSFPHHLNSFDNVPVNYTKGPLVNISTKSAAGAYYENVVNYTAFCNSIGTAYNYFSLPLTNNKILFFLTSIFVQGTQDLFTTAKPVSFYVSATPLTTQTFKIIANVTKETAISRLHFSMITFDSIDVQASGKYLLIYQKVQFLATGGFYPFPIQFLGNFMIGLTQFSSQRCLNTIHFILTFKSVSGSYRVEMPPSTPRGIANKPLKSFRYTIFYLKTWICPIDTIFNPNTNMCVSCTISNCLTCFNLTHCSVCNQANNYFLNPSTGLCEISSIPGCLTFINLTSCSDCNQNLNYVLASNLTCTLCNISQNYFPNNSTQACQLCTIPNCLNCSSLTQCIQCDTTNSYYVGANNTCQYCNSTLNYLIDPATKNCVLCTIPNCLNCSTLTSCGTCMIGYLKNTSDNLCYVCSIPNCITCSTFTACSICNSIAGYSLDSVSGLCYLCSLVGCLSCTTSTICGQCNSNANYIKMPDGTCQTCAAGSFANDTTNSCDTCTLSQCLICSTLTSCSNCNTLNSYYINTGGTCSYCDPLLSKFINTITSACEDCNLIQCLTCSSFTTCSTCNTSSNYLLNSTDNLCYPCTLSNCLQCIDFNTCSICDAASGYAINSLTGLCQLCTLTGCVNCSDTDNCVECDITGNYILLTNRTCQQCGAGQFANPVLQVCEACSKVNCTICATLNTCSQCDYLLNSYLVGNGNCAYCDPSNNKFINLTNYQCQPCIVSNCLTCDSLTTCTQCNSLFFLNPADDLCYSCSLPNCVLCASLTTCSICDTANGYALNTVSQLCQLCLLAGCTNCSSTTTCAECDSTDNYYLLPNLSCNQCDTNSGYFLNVTTMTCEICPLMPTCLTCSSLSSCSICDTSLAYFLDPTTNLCNYCDYSLNFLINPITLDCQACSIPNCLNCSTLATCQQCDGWAGFYLNTITDLCDPCNIPNCILCNNLTSCSVCDYSIGYALNLTTQLCQPCTLEGCANCSSTQTCIKCNTGQNYVLLSNSLCFQCDQSQNLFANQTSSRCQQCDMNNCLTCSSLTTCISCNITNSYYLLPDSTCGYCNSSNNKFINFINSQCQACNIQNCLNCSSLFQCRVCNPAVSSFVNLTDYHCYPCNIPYCFRCETLTMCQICDLTSLYFLNTSSGFCERCSIDHCVSCSSLTTCSQCDYFANYGFDFTSPNMSLCGPCNVSCFCDGYGLPWRQNIQECTPICGDGLIRIQQECDDGNLVQGDGCSSQCKIQIFYTCISEPSVCNQTIDIIFEQVSIQKTGCNQFKITVFSPLFTLEQIQNYFWIVNKGVNIIKKTQNQRNFEITAVYNRDIVNQAIQLDFWPGLHLNITYNPELLALYYSQTQCETLDQSEILVQSVQIVSYIILIASLFSCKIVGLQLFGLLQLTYFSLSQHSFLNIYMAPLIKFKTFNGLNIQINDQSSTLPDNYDRMSIASTFLNNCNLMLFLMLAELIIAGCVLMAGNISGNQKAKNIGKHLVKQGFITFVLFNIFNISFSAGVHSKYARQSDPNYVLGNLIIYGVLAVIIVSVIAMEATTKRGYGEFKDKFKQGWFNRMYIPLTVCHRAVIGFYIAVQSEYNQSTLIVLGLCFIYLMYFLINLPFKDYYQNYRAGLIHISMMCTLVVANYYRTMKSTTALEIKGRIYTPALIQITLIILSICVSLLILVYQIYLKIEKWNRSKTQNKKIGQTQSMENNTVVRQQPTEHFQDIQ